MALCVHMSDCLLNSVPTPHSSPPAHLHCPTTLYLLPPHVLCPTLPYLHAYSALPACLPHVLALPPASCPRPPPPPPHCRYIWHALPCFDWGVCGWMLQSPQVVLARYRYFFLINCSVRGPYRPPLLQVGQGRPGATLADSGLDGWPG